MIKLNSNSTLSVFRLLAKDSLVFGVLNAISKFFSLFLTPLFTSQLTKEEYGTMDIINQLMSISGTIIILGMDSAIARFYYKDESLENRKKIISIGFWVQMLTSILVVIFIVSLKVFILSIYLKQSYKPSQDIYITIMALIIFLSTPLRFAQNLLIWTYERKKYIILVGGFIFLNFFSIVVSLYLIDNKLQAIFVGQIPSATIFSVLSILYIKKYLVFKAEIRLFLNMLKYGSPLLLLALIPALIPALDRYFISSYGGLEQVANYGIGYRIATLVALPISSINTALGPYILSIHKTEKAEIILNLICYIIILVITSLIILIIICAPQIVLILANIRYLPGIIVVAPLSYYFLIDMLKSICASGIDISMKTYWNLVLYPFSFFILFLLLKFLTPSFGIIGAASALFLSALLNFNLTTFVGKKVFHIKYNQFKISFFISISFFITLILGFSYKSDYYYLYGIITLILFPLLGSLFFFSNEQRVYVYNLIKTRIIKQ